MLGILGLTAVAVPLTRAGVGWSDLLTMIGFAVLLVAVLLPGLRLGRRAGVVLLVGYLAYVGLLLPR